MAHELLGHLPAVISQVLEHEAGALHGIFEGHVRPLKVPGGLGKLLPILVTDIPVGPFLAAHPIPLLSDGCTTFVLGGDGDTIITVDIAYIRFAHLAVINGESQCVLAGTVRQYLHSAAKDVVINTGFLALLIIDDVVHLGELFASEYGPPLLVSCFHYLNLAVHTLLQQLLSLSCRNALKQFALLFTLFASQMNEVRPTTFDKKINEILVLLVDVSAFRDVKLHGAGVVENENEEVSVLLLPQQFPTEWKEWPLPVALYILNCTH